MTDTPKAEEQDWLDTLLIELLKSLQPDNDFYPEKPEEMMALAEAKAAITSHYKSLMEEAVIKAVWQWNDGWRFCESKLDDDWAKANDEWRSTVIKHFGNPPFGSLVYSDDCACQIDGAEGLYGPVTCGCICHKKAREFAEVVLAQLLGDKT